jgi:hypothetical protein
MLECIARTLQWDAIPTEQVTLDVRVILTEHGIHGENLINPPQSNHGLQQFCQPGQRMGDAASKHNLAAIVSYRLLRDVGVHPRVVVQERFMRALA